MQGTKGKGKAAKATHFKLVEEAVGEFACRQGALPLMTAVAQDGVSMQRHSKCFSAASYQLSLIQAACAGGQRDDAEGGSDDVTLRMRLVSHLIEQFLEHTAVWDGLEVSCTDMRAQACSCAFT